MLKDYPIKFDSERIFTPSSWEESSAVVESVNETEAGTDQIIVMRYDKLSVTASFQCSSRWAGKFKAYSKRDSIMVSSYDVESQGYTQRVIRIRSFKSAPVERPERKCGTDGLWLVFFTLEEF